MADTKKYGWNVQIDGVQYLVEYMKGTKIVIVDGEIQCEEEIYTFLNEIYLSKMLPEELQNEAKKLMIN